MKFALYQAIPNHSSARERLTRRWFKRYLHDTLQPAWTGEFAEAAQMDIEQAAATYKTCDDPALGRILGIVPIE